MVNCAVQSTIFFLITTKVTISILQTSLRPHSDLTQTSLSVSYCCFRCLNEFSFVCRSATYDVAAHTCSLSRFTRRTHPELLEDDPNCDYLENTCLNGKCSRYRPSCDPEGGYRYSSTYFMFIVPCTIIFY